MQQHGTRMQTEPQAWNAVRCKRPESHQVEGGCIGGVECVVDCPLQTRNVGQVRKLTCRWPVYEEAREHRPEVVQIAGLRRVSPDISVACGIEKAIAHQR